MVFTATMIWEVEVLVVEHWRLKVLVPFNYIMIINHLTANIADSAKNKYNPYFILWR